MGDLDTTRIVTAMQTMVLGLPAIGEIPHDPREEVTSLLVVSPRSMSQPMSSLTIIDSTVPSTTS
jgi:hypothetical protein